MSHDKRRPCARCGRDCHIGSNTGALVVCRDCRATDGWYVQEVTYGDQRLRTSARKRREADKTAADLVAVLRGLARRQVLERAAQPVPLDVCEACGSLERSDRACQVCKARRAAA